MQIDFLLTEFINFNIGQNRRWLSMIMQKVGTMLVRHQHKRSGYTRAHLCRLFQLDTICFLFCFSFFWKSKTKLLPFGTHIWLIKNLWFCGPWNSHCFQTVNICIHQIVELICSISCIFNWQLIVLCFAIASMWIKFKLILLQFFFRLFAVIALAKCYEPMLWTNVQLKGEPSEKKTHTQSGLPVWCARWAVSQLKEIEQKGNETNNNKKLNTNGNLCALEQNTFCI